MRCLVIEDEIDTARYICNGLKEAGFDVDWCQNGVDGLHLAADENWDVVILDRLLPGNADGQALLRRSAMHQDVTELMIADLKLDLRRHRAERANKVIALQPREFRLLEYLFRNQGQVVTRTMLLEAVWEYHFDPQTNVIDVQISRLRHRIDKGFSPQLLHTVRGAGYMIAVHD
jgi:two-component system OmpR family response regulator